MRVVSDPVDSLRSAVYTAARAVLVEMGGGDAGVVVVSSPFAAAVYLKSPRYEMMLARLVLALASTARLSRRLAGHHGGSVISQYMFIFSTYHCGCDIEGIAVAKSSGR